MGKRQDCIPIDDYKWELYDITKDFSEANNMAAKDPKRLRELQELFWIEAAKYQVLPLDNSKLERMNVDNRPSLTRATRRNSHSVRVWSVSPRVLLQAS